MTKAPPADQFGSDLGKADFASQHRLDGPIAPNTSVTLQHSGTPRYVALSVSAQPNTTIDIWTRSSDDAVAWLLDKNFKVAAINDDSEGSDSHIVYKSDDGGNYILMIRDYDDNAADFDVTRTDSDSVVIDSPIPAGVFRSLNGYGNPDGFGPYMIDIVPPKLGSNKWTLRSYMHSSKKNGCWEWSARLPFDGQAELVCNDDCEFRFDSLDKFTDRKVMLHKVDGTNLFEVVYSPSDISDPSWGTSRRRLEWLPDEDPNDTRLCSGCPQRRATPDQGSSYYGPPICDASCQGVPAPFGFQSPLVLSLDDADVEFTGESVPFDYRANATQPLLDWIKPSASFLVLDLNRNGAIDTGRELFGTTTRIGSSNIFAENGFAALKQYDLNDDNQIDASDPIYTDLLLWTDIDELGVSSPNELRLISEVGVQTISLDETVFEHDPETKASYVDSEAFFIYQPKYCAPVERTVSDVWFAIED